MERDTNTDSCSALSHADGILIDGQNVQESESFIYVDSKHVSNSNSFQECVRRMGLSAAAMEDLTDFGRNDIHLHCGP